MNISASLGLEVGQQIGALEGRNSKVYLARDPQLNADVVVKIVSKRDIRDPNDYFAEARKLYEARHPNVVDVRYACETPDDLYLVMPHYGGGSLHAICRSVRLTNRDVVRFGLDMLQGLHHVHAKRLVHFDVKPSNVLFDGTGKAALADFGISKHLSEHGLATADRLYFLHLPPEYLLSQELSQAADIYQAGLTLYRMLVGIDSLEIQATPFHRDRLLELIAAGSFPDRRAFPLHVSARMKSVVRKALEVAPDRRFPTVLDMIAALADVGDGLDWSYSPANGGTEVRWEMLRGVQLMRIELAPSGGNWAVSSTSTNVATGRSRRLTKYSGSGLQWGAARTMIVTALRELE